MAGTKRKTANTLRLAWPIMFGSLIFSPDANNSAEYDTGNSAGNFCCRLYAGPAKPLRAEYKRVGIKYPAPRLRCASSISTRSFSNVRCTVAPLSRIYLSKLV